MNHIEDIFGNEPIELVIRLYPSTIKAFNGNNSLLLFEEMKEQLTGVEQNCYFQNLGEGNHKVVLPIESKGYQAEFFIAWHETTFSYKTLTKSKYKPILKEFISLPESDFIQERCAIKFIDLNEPYRTKDELEHLFNRISELEVPVGIDIDKENEIWFKYIDATKKIIEKRQQPFDIRGYYPVKPIGSDFEKATRFSFKVDLKIEENREYKSIEEKLRELDVDNPRFDNEGCIYLTIDDIFNALDPVLEKEFQGVVIREKHIGCIIKIRPVSTLLQLREDLEKLNWNIKTYGNFDKKEFYFTNAGNNSKQVRLPKEIINKYNLQRKGLYARFKLKGKNGEDSFKEMKEKVDVNLYGRWFENRKQAFFERIVRERKKLYDNGYAGVSKPDICEAYSYSSDIELSFSDEFWLKLKRDLYALPFEVEYNEFSETLFFEFDSIENLEQKIKDLKDIGTFSFFFKPEGFK
ncbi:MAG: hypothetical protein KDE33_22170 [Bacteroidetes bacterium]|nr:hypothetical protein [Bacteroidota bacterium]